MHRQISFEPLERREMLSVAPTVTDVSLISTQWSSSFIDELEDDSLGYGGYSVFANSDPAPWDNIDQIKFTFDHAVNVQSADLSLSGINVTAYLFSNFSYNSMTYEATWTLSQPLGVDKLFLDLDADGLDPVDDGYGNVLDGDGNGTGGDDYELRFDVLPGDANQDGTVGGSDWSAVDALDGKTTNDSEYDPLMDLDGYGGIDSGDTDIVDEHYGGTLPIGYIEGESNDAPTTDGFLDLSLNEDSANSVIDLHPRFDDAEDTDSELTYTVVSNSNSELFDSVTINGSDQLVLSYATDKNGSADIVIRATDTGGLIVETTLHVVVAAVNDAPVISNFTAVHQGNNVWIFSGHVTDVDDGVTGFRVDFGGIVPLEGEFGYAYVDGNGNFSISVVVLPSEYGDATAITTDGEDESDTAAIPVG